MEENKLICNKLQNTNDLNEIYCDIHDGFVRQTLGQKIDYTSILDELTKIDTHLQQEIKECENIHTENNNEAKQVLKVLFDYQKLLNLRINTLHDIILKLYNKAENCAKYSFFSYRADMKNLNHLEKLTGSIGESFQDFAVVFMRKYNHNS